MPHKLLLADDSVTIQRVIELTFAEEDVRVIAVGDGKQAIDRIQSERPDIVLADVGMPERDGYEVAAFVKGNPELAHVPVLLLTGAFEPIDEPRARAAGCDGVLVKPFEPQMVINRVKDLLAGRRPAGLWTSSPPAQPARRSPGEMDVSRPSSPAPPKAGGDHLDDYFDRLDAVFADLESETPEQSKAPAAPQAPPPSRWPESPPAAQARPEAPQPRGERADFVPGDVLADWDPELTGDPTKPSRILDTPVVNVPSAGFTAPPSPAATPPAPPVSPATPHATAAASATLPHGPSLAEAFAALLAAELGQPISPAAARPVDIPEDTIESIVTRVVDRMSNEAVRSTVVDVAERLVREEIERIKRGG